MVLYMRDDTSLGTGPQYSISDSPFINNQVNSQIPIIDYYSIEGEISQERKLSKPK